IIGDDNIQTGDGNNIVFAGSGADTVLGGEDADLIVGDNASIEFIDSDNFFVASLEIYYGGTDILDGGDGQDILIGGAGTDFLAGNLGEDLLFGGAVAITVQEGVVTKIVAPLDPATQALFGGFGADNGVDEEEENDDEPVTVNVNTQAGSIYFASSANSGASIYAAPILELSKFQTLFKLSFSSLGQTSQSSSPQAVETQSTPTPGNLQTVPTQPTTPEAAATPGVPVESPQSAPQDSSQNTPQNPPQQSTPDSQPGGPGSAEGEQINFRSIPENRTDIHEVESISVYETTSMELTEGAAQTLAASVAVGVAAMAFDPRTGKWAPLMERSKSGLRPMLDMESSRERAESTRGLRFGSALKRVTERWFGSKAEKTPAATQQSVIEVETPKPAPQSSRRIDW
ncbi:MAG: hypothetical protein ACKVQK_19075, partial [Burkholderiales bacterium]